MKKILLALVLSTVGWPVFAASHWPQPVGAVNDFAHVIPADQAQQLESYLDEYQQKTGNAIVVVTFPSVEGADVDRAGVELFQAWGIGQKGKDNGILILASINDRRARIEVGYGLEGVVTDANAGDILRQQVYPYFKQQQYGAGLTNAAQALVQLIQRGGQGQVQANETDAGLDIGAILKIILVIVIVIIYLYIRIRFGGLWGGGYYRGGGGWGGGGWGGGFGGGGGGGFGGFGGGGSGGGGASGGW